MTKPIHSEEYGKTHVILKRNGRLHHIEAQITVELYPEDREYDCEPEEDKNKTNQDIESGLADHVIVIVKARAEGLEGQDILGGVLLYQPNDLADVISEYDMKNNACRELRDLIVDACNRFSAYN